MTRFLTTFVLLVLAPGMAGAQARFQTGAFAWTPTITLRDAGLDTNVYDESVDPKSDTVAVLSPQFEGALELSRFTLETSAQADFVYFERYTDERSVNLQGALRIEVPLNRLRPFAGAGYADTRERQNSEIDLRARRTERDVMVGIGFALTPRGAVEISARRSDLAFREGQVFREIDLASRLNRTATAAGVRFRYALTPLTRLTVNADLARDRFDAASDQDTDNLRVQGGFEFSPDAVIRGQASVGFHRMTPRGAQALPFEGWITSVDLGYVLLGRTRFTGLFSRDTAYSLDTQPYYLRTNVGGEVLHHLVGPIDLIGRGTRETLDYPGLPERALPSYRTRLFRYGGALAIRAAERFRITLNYELAERDTESELPLAFDRRRVYTTITYGF